MSEPEAVLEVFTSEQGAQRGAARTPLLVYGHMAREGAARFAKYSTLSTVAIAGLDVLRQLLTKKLPTVGILAMSRTSHVGEAEAAIKLYREETASRGMALYGAWDYNVARAATRALACGADGISMPGSDVNESFAYLFGVLQEVLGGAGPPTTLAAHEARLRRYTSDRSPFWRNQDRIVSTYY